MQKNAIKNTVLINATSFSSMRLDRNLRKVIDESDSPIFTHNKDMEIIFANKAYLELSGKTLKNVSGKKYWTIYPLQKLASTSCLKAIRAKKEMFELHYTPNNEVYVIRTFPVFNGKKYLFSVHVFEKLTKADIQKKHQSNINKLIVKLTKIYNGYNSDEPGGFVRKVLFETGKIIEGERICVALFSEDMSNIKTEYEWVDKKKGVKPQIKHLQHISAKQYPWFVKQVRTKKEVLVPDIEKLPKAAEKEKAAWRKIGYKSLLLVPLTRYGKHIGFVGSDMFTGKKEWLPEEIGLLHVVADLISQALKQQKHLQAIQHRIMFEHFIADMSKEIAITDPLKSGKLFNKLLKSIGQHVGVDRTCISLFSEDMSNIKTEYEWVDKKKGVKPLIKHLQHISAKQYPWFVKQVLTKKEVLVPDIEKLPKAAEKEKAAWRKIGYKSLLLVPLTRYGKHIGFICFDMFTSKKEWMPEDIEMLHIISELISQFLARQITQSQLSEREKHSYYTSRHDDLTDLPNRLAFHETLDAEISKAKRFNRQIAFLLFDLDFFKNVNDTYGHDIGDLLLQQVAERLKTFCRKEDYVARLGGDEFAMILTDLIRHTDAGIVAVKLLELLKNVFIINEFEVHSGASIGITNFPISGENANELYKHADIALYQAKQYGRGCYRFFSEEYHKEFQQHVEIETALRTSITNNEMFLVYQPIVNMQSQEILGAEALLRWHHPEKGMIPPDEFISIAESSGLIIEIGKWIISEIYKQATAWSKNKSLHNFYLTMNLSPYQLYDDKTLNQIIEMNDQHKTSVRIDIELTESDVVKNLDGLAPSMQLLVDHNFNILVDDFGTGSSSLDRLGELSVSTLKIDRSFVSGITGESKRRKIVKMIIALAKGLGLSLVAEGVETKEQMDFLLQNGCQVAQGFYFYKPMRADELTKILEKNLDNN